MATPICDGRAALGVKDLTDDEVRAQYDLGRAALAL